MTAPRARAELAVTVDRSISTPLAVQIASNLRTAILDGRLRAGARLPSWMDLAAQLGVARGTIKAAYDALADEQLVVPSGAAGTRVALRAAPGPIDVRRIEILSPRRDLDRGTSLRPLPFQMGVPAQDGFPAKLWARLRTRAVRVNAVMPVGPPNSRGEPELRAEIAAHLAITRRISCHPDQIVLTGGYRNGLCLTMLALQAAGRSAWIEDPCCPATRMAVKMAGLCPVPIPVDAKGLRVDHGVRAAPHAAVAIVTPGQHAPTGATLSAERRAALLGWAIREDAWLVEDDTLGALQLSCRASPALAAQDPEGRVIHVGSFASTVSPAIGLGYVVAPLQLARRFAEVADCLNPAPNATTQLALADFLRQGHFLRHLRHMKRLYKERRQAMLARLDPALRIEAAGGLTAIVRLPRCADDVALAHRAPELGIAPSPLSIWSSDPAKARQGFVLSVTNLHRELLDSACDALLRLIESAPCQVMEARAA
ncbi:PLP-dependent aminotransferase family protein [Sphingosinicella sp. BN140058]|uniref:aminotransferase-like domain-containing protein n=1 Tax=Sphingosinicella sp. BN140058 TaxID=1892855 RepID=UPI0010119983|nr:PLP-dependent aminotransferase family protein [Sphingosinicella sp. BN140058]QAY80047.1 PLP-dependent aminotransferase family protein [Sphingosinicella sp. BN140058]